MLQRNADRNQQRNPLKCLGESRGQELKTRSSKERKRTSEAKAQFNESHHRNPSVAAETGAVHH